MHAGSPRVCVLCHPNDKRISKALLIFLGLYIIYPKYPRQYSWREVPKESKIKDGNGGNSVIFQANLIFWGNNDAANEHPRRYSAKAYTEHVLWKTQTASTVFTHHCTYISSKELHSEYSYRRKFNMSLTSTFQYTCIYNVYSREQPLGQAHILCNITITNSWKKQDLSEFVYTCI